MKNRYRIYVRGKHSGGKVWWIQDNQTGKRESLGTTDKNQARALFNLKNEPHQVIDFHAQIAQAHLMISDPERGHGRRVLFDVAGTRNPERAAHFSQQ
jgi:hypothetical protein